MELSKITRKIPGSVYPYRQTGRFRAQEPRSRGAGSKPVDTEEQGWAWLDERDTLYRLETLGALPAAHTTPQPDCTLREIWEVALANIDLKDTTKEQYSNEIKAVALKHPYADIPGPVPPHDHDARTFQMVTCDEAERCVAVPA